MGYRKRWKPSKAARNEYAENCRRGNDLYNFINSRGPIREGCFVKFWHAGKGEVVQGTITNSSYGSEKGQHTFTVAGIRIKGRNLYPWLIEHEPGEISLQENAR